VILLGSTGSIGVNTLKIAQEFELNVEVLSANSNIELLNLQIERFSPKYVVIGKKELIKNIKHPRVLYGSEGLLEALNLAKSKLVVNALVGFAGLAPSIEALRLNKKLALANKESLVVAGVLLDSSKIIPIDSEHFALWYLLQNNKKIDSLEITASGGALRDAPLDKLKSITPKEALNHPNWSMGEKITIDSATMVNKLFELLEARWLYDCRRVDAFIERKSLLHGVANFVDGSTVAHFAQADMRLPIAFALLGSVSSRITPKISLKKIGSLKFEEIRADRYPIWELKDELLKNPHKGVVLNASNEIAVEWFLKDKIGFLDITKINKRAYAYFSNIKISSLEDIFNIDKEVREFVKRLK
jgi:1-deoxy-D-xylulose-5-phosphate reductoisomerase